MHLSRRLLIVACGSAPFEDAGLGGRVNRCTNSEQLRLLASTETIDVIIYTIGVEGSMPIHEFMGATAPLVGRTVVLIRMALDSRNISDLCALARAGFDVRVSITDIDSVSTQLSHVERCMVAEGIRASTTELLTSIVPIIPRHCRAYGVAALIIGGQKSSVAELRRACGLSDRLLRLRFAEIGLPAHRMLALSLACHASRLIESGVFNVGQVAKYLGFDDPDSYSSKIKRTTEYSPADLATHTNTEQLIVEFRASLLAGQSRWKSRATATDRRQ